MKKAIAFIGISSLLMGMPASAAPGIKYAHDITFAPKSSEVVRANNIIKNNEIKSVEVETISKNVAVEEVEAPIPASISENVPTAEVTAEVDVELASYVNDLSACKVPDVNVGTIPHSKGFPMSGPVPHTGTVNFAIVPIQFDDVLGTSQISEYKKHIAKMDDWSRFMSNGRMEYNVTIHDEWISVPGKAKDYNCVNCRSNTLFNNIISASRNFYDYDSVHFIYFMVPKEARELFYTELYGSFTLNGRTVKVFTWGDDPGRIWNHAIHEILHDQGFIGHGPANGSNYGIMMGQWGQSLAVLSWPSFMAGWFDEDDIVCIDARNGLSESVNVKINSLDKLGGSPGIKSVIVRYGTHKAFVVEYRTNGQFSTLNQNQFGVTVYTLDTSIAPHRCDSCGPQEYEDEKNWWNYVRLPNSFDGYKNGNINFTSRGPIGIINGIKISIVDKNIVRIG